MIMVMMIIIKIIKIIIIIIIIIIITVFIQGAHVTGKWYSVRPCKINR